MKYLQLFETTRHPWTGEIRRFYIIWSQDGKVVDHGVGHPASLPEDGVVRLRPILNTKIKDYQRTVETANSPT